MKLKKISQVLLLSAGILVLGACSTTGTNSSDTMSDADGVQSAGLGDSDGFGDQGKMTKQQLLAKRTYYFNFDNSTVRDQDKPAIYANADYLVAHPEAKITLEGHTDPRGSREYNVGLGERRANSVLEALKARGVNPNQIHVVSYGAEKLAAAGRTETDYQLDRRAIILYTKS